MFTNCLNTSLNSFPAGLAILGDYLYVVNAGTETLPNTFISKVSLKPFRIVKEDWITGIEGSMFLASDNSHLYVSSGLTKGHIARILLSDNSIDNTWAEGSNSLTISGDYMYLFNSDFDIIQISLRDGGSGKVWKSDKLIMPYFINSDKDYLYMSTYDNNEVFVGRISLTNSNNYDPYWFKLTSINTINASNTLMPNSSLVHGDYIYLTLTEFNGKKFSGITYVGKINVNNVKDADLLWRRINVNSISFGLATDGSKLYVSDSLNCAIQYFDLFDVVVKEEEHVVLIVKEKEADVLSKDVILTVEEDPIVVVEDPIVVIEEKEEPIVVIEEKEEPIKVEEEPIVVVEDPIVVIEEKEEPIVVIEEKEEPIKVEEEPIKVEEEPIKVEEEPIVVIEEKEEPIVVIEEKEEPIKVEEEPIKVEEEPIVVEEEPIVVIEEEPIKEVEPIVVVEEPIPFSTIPFATIPFAAIPFASVCFLSFENTIQTDQGRISLNRIMLNYNTINSKPILKVQRSISVDDYFVVFSKESLNNNYPTEDTITMSSSLIDYNGKLVEASSFIGINDKVRKLVNNGTIYYRVLI
jgi:hypothetical protein